jgi:hypothetical protein
MYIRLPARIAILATLMLVLFGGSWFHPDLAAARSAEYDRFDVQLTVLDDGTFRIVETQTVDFTDGPFIGGHRSIPLTRISGVENVAVSELVDGDLVPFELSDSEEYDTYWIARSSTEVDIQWTFPPARDEIRTFVVEYDLIGALRYYPNETPPNQQVWYIPVGSALTSETPVNAGTLTIDLPRPIDPASIVLAIDGEQFTDLTPFTTDNQRFVFEHGDFASGDSWEIRLQSEVVALDAEIPAWQTSDDELRIAREEQEARDTQWAGWAAIGAIGLAIGGGLAMFLLWFARGRDPHTGAIASFLPEPPDSTPPAIVGVLIDERVHQRDIVSTLTDWGHRGLLVIHEPSGGTSTLELKSVPEELTEFEKLLAGIVFPQGPGQIVPFASARNALQVHEKALEAELYREVEQLGYFRKNPEAIRDRWSGIATVITSLSIAAGIIGSIAFSSWIILPAATVTVLSLVLRFAARALPQRTRAGAEATAKWRAFERYLKDLEKYDTLETAKANFERFLPYTIIFGLEKGWIGRFNAANHAPTPTWYDNTDFGEVLERRPRRSGGDWPPVIITGGGSMPSGSGSGGDFNFPDINMPDLQDTSRKAAQGIGGASSGGVNFLNILGAIVEIASIFAGGGGKGGGSGGGGGGFR